MKCQFTKGCRKPATAKVGLPRANAIWACEYHFYKWRKSKGEEA